MRAAAVVVLALLAGCSSVPAPTAEGPTAMATWKEGDWWSYDVTTPNGSLEATLVYDGQRLLITDRELGRELSRHMIPLLAGEFSNGTWSGSFWENSVFDPVEEWVEFEWVRWPVNETPQETRRARGYGAGGSQAHLEVVSSNATHATFAYGGPFGGTGVFDARLGWLQRIDILHPVRSTWELVDSGSGFSGQAWDVEHRSADRTVLGVSSYDLASRDANVMVVDYHLACARPGAFDFRISPERLVSTAAPYVWYTDTCPDDLHRLDVVEADFPELVAYEVTGGVADPGVWGGDVMVTFLLEQARSF